MAEITWKRSEPRRPTSRPKYYAFEVATEPGIWRCSAVPGPVYLTRATIERWADAAGVEVTFIEHRPGGAE